jgi:hypothetical protein
LPLNQARFNSSPESQKEGNSMSYSILPRTLKEAPGLTMTAKVLLAELWEFRNRQTGQCNPRIAKLAERLGVVEKTIDRALASLYQIGLVVPRKGQRGNSYSIAPKTEWAVILQGQNVPAETGSAGTKCPRAQGQNVPAGAPYPLYEPSLRELHRAARGFPSKKNPSPKPPARALTMDERVLAAYYAEKRRKAVG